MRRHAVLAFVAVLGSACAAPIDSDESAFEEREEVESAEAALENSGKTVWAVTAPSQYAFVLLGLDRSGNIYVRTTLQHQLFKYDPYGKLLWQRSLAVADRYAGVDAATVDADGNIYYAGDQRTDYDVPSTHLYDHYLAKMGTDGSMVFRRTRARAVDTAVFAKQIVIDDARNIWIAGRATGNADLGGGALPDGAGEGHRPYLAKYSSSGALLFAKTAPVTARNVSAETEIGGISYAPSGGVWITGFMRRAWDLGCGVDPNGTGFLAGIASDGACKLQRVFGSDIAPSAVAHSTDGRVAIAGTFRGTIDFGGASLSNGTASADMFLATFDAESGNVGWVKRASGTAAQYVDGIAFDRDGYLAVVGRIFSAPEQTNRTFKLGTFETTMNDQTWRTIVGRFTPRTGATSWVREYGDLVLSSGGIAVNSTNRVMAAGWFTGPTDLGRGTVGAPGERRRFLMRLYP